jgi:hypothetical protein
VSIVVFIGVLDCLYTVWNLKKNCLVFWHIVSISKPLKHHRLVHSIIAVGQNEVQHHHEPYFNKPIYKLKLRSNHVTNFVEEIHNEHAKQLMEFINNLKHWIFRYKIFKFLVHVILIHWVYFLNWYFQSFLLTTIPLLIDIIHLAFHALLIGSPIAAFRWNFRYLTPNLIFISVMGTKQWNFQTTWMKTSLILNLDHGINFFLKKTKTWCVHDVNAKGFYYKTITRI